MINSLFIFSLDYDFSYFVEDSKVYTLFSESVRDENGLVYSKDGSKCLPDCLRKQEDEDRFIWCNKRKIEGGYDRKEYHIREGVRVIYDGAFSGCEDAVIIIPDSVRRIGAAFQYCENIRLSFKGHVPTQIEKDAFFHSSNVSLSFDEAKSGNEYLHSLGCSENCFMLYDRLLSFSNDYIVPSIPFITGNDKYDEQKGLIIIPSVGNINQGILHGAAVVDMRNYRGNINDIPTFFYCDREGGESYWDKNKCKYVVVSEKQAQFLLPSYEYLTIVNLERCDTNVIGIIDYDKRFQTTIGNLVYSPHKRRVIKTKSFDDYCFPDPDNLMLASYSNGKKGIIEEGTEVICDYAFAMWEDLEEIVIPNSVKRIGKGAFLECNSLKSVIIPEGVEIIENYTFAECHWLEKVVLPSTLKEIKPYAFKNCFSLSSIIIPSSVHTCPWEAFDGCLIEKTSGPFPYDTKWMDRNDRYSPAPGFGERNHFIHNISPFSKCLSNIHENSYYLFFDTETSGLPDDSKAPSSDVDNWPRLVQLGWIITNRQGEVLSKVNRLIYPYGFEIDEDATVIHHISDIKARDDGEPLIDVLEEFIIDLRSVAFVVGHNVDFDKKVLGAEMIRCGMPDIIGGYPSIDTMIMGMGFTEYEDSWGRKKYPKLSELHATLFGVKHVNAHDAMGDIEATVKCFFKMKNSLYFSENATKIYKGKLTQNQALIDNLVSARIRNNRTERDIELSSHQEAHELVLFMKKGKPIKLLVDDTDKAIHCNGVSTLRIEPSSIEIIDCIEYNGERRYVAKYKSIEESSN